MDARSPSTPISPYTLANERYKTNVNRTKTRKWVEAKKVDYGGDDWGGDEYDDDDADSGSASGSYAPPPQPQPQAIRPGRLAGMRAIGDGSGGSTPRSGSAGSVHSMRPSERIALERQGSSGPQQRSVTGPPALSIHTGVQAQDAAAPAVADTHGSTPGSAAASSPFPPRKSSMNAQDRPDLTADAIVHPPRTSSRPESPALGSGVRSPASGAPKIIRPSEIYKRMEEERQKEKERSSMESARRASLESTGSRAASAEGDRLDSALKSPRRPSFGRNDSGDGSRTLQQPLAPVAERKSEYDLTGLMTSTNSVAPAPGDLPSTETPRDTETEPASQAPAPATALPSQPAMPTLQTSDEDVNADSAADADADANANANAHRPAVQEQDPLNRRYSVSPKLPDFTRLSGFGSDFFSSGGGFLMGSSGDNESPKQPEAPAEPATAAALESGAATGVTRTAEAEPAVETSHDPGIIATVPAAAAATADAQQHLDNQLTQPKPFRPSIPGGWVSESASTPGEMAATPFSEVPRPGFGRINTEDLKPAPLRTPTPRQRESFSKSGDEDKLSNKSNQASPNFKPLPLRTSASPLVRSERSSIADGPQTPAKIDDTEPSNSTEVTPVAPPPLQPRTSSSSDELDNADPHAPILKVDTADNASPLKESDVLRDEIIRSLSPVRSSNSQLDALKDESAARESTYLSDVYGDYWRPEGPPVKEEDEDVVEDAPKAVASASPSPPAEQDNSLVEETPAVAAAEPEETKPPLRRERFSWEPPTEDNTPAPSSPTKAPHPLPELPKDNKSEAVPTSGVPGIASPADAEPLSPMLALPVSNYGREHSDASTDFNEREPSRNVSGVSQLTITQDTPRDTPLASPDFVADNTTAVAVDDIVFSPVDDKFALASPAANSPTDQQPPTPTNIPLPHSPTSPTKPEGTQQNVLTLKQIMALPTSPERVYKMLEARAEFASPAADEHAQLEVWLAQLTAAPEHANAGPGFKYPPAGGDLPLFAHKQQRRRRATTIGGNGAVEEDGDGLEGGGGGLTNSGSVRIPGAPQLGQLMHGQAGTKGKELLQSAGKMGKGLLSKGKNKLRERAESKKG